MATLTCSRCGYAQPVRLETEDGQPVTMEEYLFAHQLTGETIVCASCVTEDDDVTRTVLEP